MQQLPEALAPLASYAQFLTYKLVPSAKPGGKPDKIPCDPRTGRPFPLGSNWQQDPARCVDAATALQAAAAWGPEYGVGFLFTPNDPFFFLDIDGAYNPASGWNQTAVDMCARFPGCAVEVSTSGAGLHIIGTGRPSAPEEVRRKKSPCRTLELYTQWRFVALTGTHARGSAADQPAQAVLDQLVTDHFTRADAGAGAVADWTEGPTEDYTPLTDPELLERACKTAGAAAALGGRASFRDLFAGEPEPLGRSYPADPGNVDPYDRSSADAALAQMLAFWTGRDCARTERLMRQSALVRDKWDSARARGTYLQETILNAVARQETVYTGPAAAAERNNAPADETLAALQGSPRATAWAEQIRAEKLAELGPDTPDGELLARERQARWWIDNRDRSGAELAEAIRPVEHVEAPGVAEAISEPQLVSGYQYLGASQQLELFAGCVYVQGDHRIFTPAGDLLKTDQFNATYGGFVFQLDDTGRKTTRKAWEAFTESQIIRFPKAHSVCYRPDLPAGQLITEEGRTLVNIFVPATVDSTPGDVSLFLDHVSRLLPAESDRETLLSYMAACVQMKGRKFQWAPLIQGVAGNGKTLFTRCVQQAIGKRHTHMPRAENIAEKFNGWVFNKVFIGVEDIYVPEHKREIIEILKPMITGEDLERRAMHSDQEMREICANFIFNSNYKDAVRKTEDDRRFCVFYTEQQTKPDMIRDGLTADYFHRLYGWLKYNGGYAAVAHYLQTYQITEEFKKLLFYRAPETTATPEAIRSSRGGVEQEVEESIEENAPGFSGGWISSIALNQLLDRLPAGRKMSQRKRAEMLADLGYVRHPGLNDGRTTMSVLAEGNRRPRLYVRRGHLSANLTSGADILNAYLKAQGHVTQGAPESARNV